jgi:hypothetical protein
MIISIHKFKSINNKYNYKINFKLTYKIINLTKKNCQKEFLHNTIQTL